MTGVSLGLRASGSYGSLQQHAPDGGLQSSNLYISRRPSKLSLNGHKEKERHSHSTFRYLSPRKVGMLILAALALFAFMTGFFTVDKEADLRKSDLNLDMRDPNNQHSIFSLLAGEKVESLVSSFKTNQVTVCAENTGWLSSISNASAVVAYSSAANFFSDPCKNFAFPPPPPGNRQRPGPRACPVCYVPVEQAIASMPRFPSESPVVRHLTYFSEENPTRVEANGGSEFGGYPSLKQRNESFDIKESMTVHCGFVKGCGPVDQTGFDIDAADLKELEQFHEVIVASAIFGNYDVIQQPKNIGETARKNVPFFMFVDKETEAYMKNNSILASDRQVGLWRIIVVHNVPYTDARRNGKVPKLLLHRLFPNVRFSIWIDGKLQLVVDPYQVLEKFLWRHNATFAISRHYSRFDVFEEAEANKAAGKYDNISIDYQIEYYKKEGLTPYTTAKLPITSDVPEGCVIVREHITVTNLFSCLWFNEVDRFTSRDQLSFAIVRDKVKAKTNWNINMFLDCERRNFVIQAYHRDLLEQRAHEEATIRDHPRAHEEATTIRDHHRAHNEATTRDHPPPALALSRDRTPPKKTLLRRSRGDKRPGSKKRGKGVNLKTKEIPFI